MIRVRLPSNRLVRFLIRHPRLMRGPVQRWVSRRVWAELEADPNFNEAMRQAEADLSAGRGVPFRWDVS